MFKVFTLSLLIIFAPFLHSNDIENTPEVPPKVNSSEKAKLSTTPSSGGSMDTKYRSIKIISDYHGRVFLDGKKLGKIDANSSIPYEIPNLRPGTYLLKIHVGVKFDISKEIEVESGHDTFVHMRAGEPEIGQSLSDFHNTPPSRKKMWPWIVAGGILSVAIIIGAYFYATAGFNECKFNCQ